jgi:hypothetical protein
MLWSRASRLLLLPTQLALLLNASGIGPDGPAWHDFAPRAPGTPNEVPGLDSPRGNRGPLRCRLARFSLCSGPSDRRGFVAMD